jgi:chitinase
MKIRNQSLVAISAVMLATTAGTTLAEDATITFAVPSAWEAGYSGTILIENDGKTSINGWELRFQFGPEISSLWNGDWSTDGTLTTISHLDWNMVIAPGTSVELGYSGIGTFTADVQACTLNGDPTTVVYGDGTGGSGGGDGDGGGGSGDGGGNPPSGDPCPADLDESGTVDGGDLGLMLAAWGESGVGDLDQSGTVDGADLGLMLAAWGACPVGIDGRVVAYYIEWGTYGRDYQPADIPYEKITHLNYAFADIGVDGRVTLFDEFAAIDKSFPGDTWDQPYRGLINQINNVHKPQHPHLKTMISVGGWTLSGRFSDVALTTESRSIFAESCVQFIRDYNFDGVDIDWEYPVEGGLASNVYRPEDGVNYTHLLQELRDQLDVAGDEDGVYYELSIAAPAGFDKVRHLECDRLGEILDFINVMTYDMRGAWDLSKTGHHAPLYMNPAEPGDPEIAEKYTVDFALHLFLDQGVDPSKLVMGVPFYGRAWGGVADSGNGNLFASASSIPDGTWDDWSSGSTGVNDFDAGSTGRDGILQLLESGSYTRYWDDVAKAPYLYSPTAFGGHFVSYEDEESMAHKLAYLQNLGLGGVMYWEITADRQESLVDLIAASVMAE